MTQESQKSNVVLIVIAIIGVIGTIVASIIGVIGNYNIEKLRQQTELTRMALVSIATQSGATQMVLQSTVNAATSTPFPVLIPAVDIPTATLFLQTSTPSGPTLAVNETWVQNGIEIFLDQLRVNPDGISVHVIVSNQTGQSLLFDFDSRNFSLTDNLGNMGESRLLNGRIFDIQKILVGAEGASKLEIGEKMDVDMGFNGLNFGNPSITYAILTIKELSRAKNVRWQIVIPH
jgi:hypothetical protein